MTISTPVTRSLDLLGIPYAVFQHPQPPESLEQAARERSQVPEQIIRSLLFRLSRDEYVMVLVAGPKQVAWPVLRAFLGVFRLTMASAAEVREVTGYEIGAVAPLGLPKPIRILADESVFQLEEVSIGSGVRGVAIILKSSDLRQAVGKVETGAFA